MGVSVEDGTVQAPVEPTASPSAATRSPSSRTGMLVAKVSSIPMVNSTINTLSSFYESSKSNSNIIRYGAETVESGVHRVISLVDSPTHAPPASSASPASSAAPPSNAAATASPSPSGVYATGRRYISDALGRNVDAAISVAESAVERLLPPASSAGDAVLESDHDEDDSSRSKRLKNIGTRVQGRLQHRVVNRWNHIYGQGYDGIKSARDSVDLLHKAHSHIEQQTNSLRDNLANVQQYLSTTAHAANDARTRALEYLFQITQVIKREIVNVLRKAVEAISKTAILLPGYAQARVKDFILMLPSHWGRIAAGTEGSDNLEARSLSHGHQVVSLANDTLHMLNAVAQIFTHYIDRTSAMMEAVNFGNFQPAPASAAAAAAIGASMPTSPHMTPGSPSLGPISPRLAPVSPRLLPKLSTGDEMAMTPPASPRSSPTLPESRPLGRNGSVLSSHAEAARPEAVVPEAEAALTLSTLANAAFASSRMDMA